MEEPKKIYVADRKEFREWLMKNHAKEKNVCLMLYKRHTGKGAPSHRETIEEAICFGWIDTTIKRIDKDRYSRNFVKRNAKSKWSKATQGYARDLIKRKLMTPAGILAYKEGLKRPTHDAGLSDNPEIPEDLMNELNKSKKAKENFDKFAPSYRRTYLRWLERAKRIETRKKRINLIVQMALNNNKSGLSPTSKTN